VTNGGGGVVTISTTGITTGGGSGVTGGSIGVTNGGGGGLGGVSGPAVPTRPPVMGYDAG
jgi:hypothetical protein